MLVQVKRSSLIALFLLLDASAPSEAESFRIGTADATLDGLVSVGTTIRTGDPDPALISVTNGAAAGIAGTSPSGRNQDDGNLNYRKGDAVSTVFKTLINFEMKYATYGLQVRGSAWHDAVLAGGGKPWGDVTNAYVPGASTNTSGASGARLLDANIYGTVSFGERPLFLKIGNQTVPWGVPASIAGGLSSLNPVSLPAARRPGAVADETRIPFPAIFARFGLTQQIGLEAFYQFRFQPSEMFGCGTFYSTLDYLGDGCNSLVLGGSLNDRQSMAIRNFSKRAPDLATSDQGQFGVGLTYAPAGNIRLGAYYAQYHSRTPFVSAKKAQRAIPYIVGDPDGLNPQYLVQYPERISMFGFNVQAQFPGMSGFAEIVHRPNQPVQLNSTDILNAAASNVAPTLLRQDYAAIPLGGVYNAYDRLAVTDILVGLRAIRPGILGATSSSVGGEFGLKHVHDLPDFNQRRYGRSDVFGNVPFNGQCIGAGYIDVSCTNDGFVSRNAYGVRARASLTYVDFFNDTTMTPSVTYGYDISGWSYDGVINEGRQFAVFDLRFETAKRYTTLISFNPTWGGRYNNVRDRSTISLSFAARF
ncbi:MAG: DUF1302 family protein [Pseudolabrys sp.]|nr:DUF1302 family protein [Pseudolabrys sp.]MCW5686134.1 DUF1302 family protein [Pseudolabrys sp.]